MHTNEPGRKRRRELEALVRLKDEDIDTTEIPEVADWRGAVVGKFYRPLKHRVTLRLDADIIAWLKSRGSGYQTRINALLRSAMTGEAGAAEGPGGRRRPSHTKDAGAFGRRGGATNSPRYPR
jgi:uncharacterized protein (DUF4415 family)